MLVYTLHHDSVCFDNSVSQGPYTPLSLLPVSLHLVLLLLIHFFLSQQKLLSFYHHFVSTFLNYSNPHSPFLSSIIVHMPRPLSNSFSTATLSLSSSTQLLGLSSRGGTSPSTHFYTMKSSSLSWAKQFSINIRIE